MIHIVLYCTIQIFLNGANSVNIEWSFDTKEKIGAIIPSQIPRTRSPSCSLLLRPPQYWSQQLPAGPPSLHLPAGNPSQFLRHGHTLLTSCRAWHGPAQSAHVPGQQPLWRGRCWSLRLPPSPAPISIRWGSARSGQLASDIVGEVSFYWVSKVRTLGGQYEEDMGKYISFSAFYLWMDWFLTRMNSNLPSTASCLIDLVRCSDVRMQGRVRRLLVQSCRSTTSASSRNQD